MVSDEQLKEIEGFGAVLFSEDECALVMGFDVDYFNELMEHPDSNVYKAYHKGRLQSLYLVRKNIFDMAKNGSGPAQSIIQKIIKDYEYEKVKKA